MTSNRTFISYLIWFCIPLIVFYAIAVPLAFFFGPVSGDLTRIGHWSERDYEWRREQPTVMVLPNGGSKASPQVLVLGDSFSHPNIWQSELARLRHLEVLSYQYQDVGCVDNWLRWVSEKRYPDANTAIIETVERGFIALFKAPNKCASREPKAQSVQAGEYHRTRPTKGLVLDSGYLLPVAFNTIQSTRSDGRIASSGVVNVKLVNNTLFSNRRSDRLLYYADDDLKAEWTTEDMRLAVENAKAMQTLLKAKGVRLIFVVVPDKSTAYSPYISDGSARMRYPDIAAQLTAAGVENVSLRGEFQRKVREIQDFYLPNDTHFSTRGYMEMALTIADHAF